MGDRALDPTGALLAAVQRSTRAVTLLGGGLGMFGVIIQVTGVADDLYVWGLIPVPLFMIILGPLAVIVTFVRAAEFKALEFGLTDVGVRSRDALIRWEDVAEVYLGGTTYLAEGLIRSAEERHLRVVAKDGREIELSLRLFGRMSPESSRALASIVGALLRRVGDRQRAELEARMEAGERVRFSDTLWIGADGVAEGQRDPAPIPLARVRGLECNNGRLTLRYVNEKQRLRTRSLGLIAEIANPHLLEAALLPRATRA
ncbi:MAG: hypothetical protein R3A51_15030 [Nannocystaceae bacterium]